MRTQAKASVGDVIQIDPSRENEFFRGCFAIVTAVAGWGVQAFVSIPKSRDEMPGQAFTRVPWDEFEVIGKAVWAPNREDT